MRIISTVIAIAFGVVTLFAQDNNTNQEKIYTPQTGDIAIGIDGTPIFDYLGNSFNGNPANGLLVGDQKLYFRYFLTDNSAARITLKIANRTNTNRFYVKDDAAVAADPNSNKQVEDIEKVRVRDFELRAGYQQFRGYKRLIGFYGADIGYRYEKNSKSYTYGNEMTVLNPTPTTQWGNLGVRRLEDIGGAVNSFFAGIFTGAEYYLLPKMCVGAEFGLSYGASVEKQSYVKQETMVLTQHVEEEVAAKPGDSRRFTVTEFPYTFGNFYFVVHF